MQSGSTNNSVVSDRAIQLKQPLNLNKSSAAITRKSTKVSNAAIKDGSIDSSISKSLSLIESAHTSSGSKKAYSNTKTVLYTAAILNELTHRNSSLTAKFLRQFQSNLELTKHSNLEAIKPAAHQALNELVREGDISIKDVKEITHAAWKLVFKEVSKTQSKPVNPVRSSQSIIHTRRSNSSTQRMDVPSGFLWKPISDSPPHGLAILLPAGWTGNIEGVEIIDPKNAQVLAKGEDGGVGNGDRQHYRFKSQGSEFPDGSLVRVYFSDGTIKDIAIANTAIRTEGR